MKVYKVVRRDIDTGWHISLFLDHLPTVMLRYSTTVTTYPEFGLILAFDSLKSAALLLEKWDVACYTPNGLSRTVVEIWEAEAGTARQVFYVRPIRRYVEWEYYAGLWDFDVFTKSGPPPKTNWVSEAPKGTLGCDSLILTKMVAGGRQAFALVRDTIREVREDEEKKKAGTFPGVGRYVPCDDGL